MPSQDESAFLITFEVFWVEKNFHKWEADGSQALVMGVRSGCPFTNAAQTWSWCF